MANKKITELTEATSFSADTDLIPIVTNVGTTPLNQKMTKANLQTAIGDTAAEIKTKYESNADTNVFTDAEKTNLGNQSGTNTGDQDLSGLQATLISGTNIKTINSTSLLGSGDIAISGGGGNTTRQFTFGRKIDFNSDGRWVGHYLSTDGAQVLNWPRGTGTDPSMPNYYGFILLEPNSVLKKLVLSALYDSSYTAIDIQIWGGAVNQTSITKLYSGSFSPIAPDTTLQSYDRYELDMGDISLTSSYRLLVAVRNQQDTLATRTVRGQIKLIWEES